MYIRTVPHPTKSVVTMGEYAHIIHLWHTTSLSPPLSPSSAHIHCLYLPSGGGVEGLLGPHPLTTSGAVSCDSVYGWVQGMGIWEG